MSKKVAPVVAKPVELVKTVELGALVVPLVKLAHERGVAFSENRPGVLSMIKNLLFSASPESPITKLEILDALCLAFPERDRAKMKSTVSMQVPSGLKLETKGRVAPVTCANVRGERAYYAVAPAPMTPGEERPAKPSPVVAPSAPAPAPVVAKPAKGKPAPKGKGKPAK